MSKIEYIRVDSNSEIGILDLSTYSPSNGAASKRDIERESFRFVLEQMHAGSSERLYYDEFGKPHLESVGKYISVSHSHDKIAVITNTKESTGIDIELIRDKVLNIRHKYLSVEEFNAIEENEIEKYIVYWAAKESLYKIHGRKKIDFKEHLYITPFTYNPEGGDIIGKINLVDFDKTFNLHYQKKGEYILVYMINEIE